MRLLNFMRQAETVLARINILVDVNLVANNVDVTLDFCFLFTEISVRKKKNRTF